MKPRVVLDTNVFVSGLLGGTATDVIRRWRAGDLQWVTPVAEEPSVARDASDDKFLFAAASGRADYLVSADPDLLDLKEFRNIPIVSPWEFLSLLDS
jgi:predicted nucleic acid-binding protein